MLTTVGKTAGRVAVVTAQAAVPVAAGLWVAQKFHNVEVDYKQHRREGIVSLQKQEQSGALSAMDVAKMSEPQRTLLSSSVLSDEQIARSSTSSWLSVPAVFLGYAALTNVGGRSDIVIGTGLLLLSAGYIVGSQLSGWGNNPFG